jgi:hypothetical protein
LVADGNRCKFDVFDHGGSMLENAGNRNVVFTTMSINTTALAVALFALNYYVCRELFHVEFLRHMGSIEGAYIGIARYLLAHWKDLSWFPLWYCGIPYQNTYPPLLHWCVALVSWMRGITPAHAYHWTTALAYCLGPVTVFALVRRLSGSRWAGFAAGLLYTALSPSAWLISEIAKDVHGMFDPRRLQALVFYGEGPHVAAMTLLPLAILMLDLAVSKRKGVWFSGAVATLAAVALTNWLGAFALALGVASYVLARMGTRRDFLLFVAIGAAGYALAMPWIPPSTIAVTQFNARVFVGDYHTVYQTLPRWLAVMAFGLVALKLAARRLTVALQFTMFFAALTCLITLSNAWYGVAIVPQPMRYHLEMEMALVMLAAVLGYEVLKRWPRGAMGAMIALAILLIPPVRMVRRYARNFLIRTTDITTTSEWKTAEWLNRHWSGERVMVPGAIGLWLTAFSDVPELDGGFDQGITDPEIPVANYAVTAMAGPEWPEYSVLWLKAFGVQAVGVTGEGSTEVYKPFKDPKKFDGVLDVLWRDGGDVLYRVGKPRLSLARVVPRSSLVSRTPINGADVEPLRAYVAALEDASMPEARFEWTSAQTARIVTEIGDGQAVSWQEAWHAGWHAMVAGEEIPITRDALGLMAIDPRRAGSLTIDLVFDGGREMRIAHWLSGMTALILLALVARGILKKSW